MYWWETKPNYNKNSDDESISIERNVLSISSSLSYPSYISNCFNSIKISIPLIKKNMNTIYCSGLYHNYSFNSKTTNIISSISHTLSVSITYDQNDKLDFHNQPLFVTLAYCSNTNIRPSRFYIFNEVYCVLLHFFTALSWRSYVQRPT